MKTFEFRPHVHGRPKSKIILIMKICTFILLVFNLGLSASGYSQQKKVTLDFKNATSKEFFAEIQKQTGYCFIFNTNQGEQIGEITISVRNKSVQEVMEEILRPTGFSYTFQNDIIVITPKMAEPEKNILTGLVFDENKHPLWRCNDSNAIRSPVPRSSYDILFVFSCYTRSSARHSPHYEV